MNSSPAIFLKTFYRHPITALRRQPLLVQSVLFIVSSTSVNLGNYLFNLLVGRWLGPALFADISLVVTLLLMLTFITTALSTTIAWFAAVTSAQQDLTRLAALRSWALRVASLSGGVIGIALIICALPLQQLFHMHSFWPIPILGIGLPIFFVLAVERGILQGRARFGQLAISLQSEMWMRLGGTLVALLLGLSVNGVVVVIVLSFVTGWLPTRNTQHDLSPPLIAFSHEEQHTLLRYFTPVMIGLFGQIIIANSDILIVKRFFPSQQAGLYAALALSGRMVYFATWSLVVVLFPIVARHYQRGEPHRHWLWLMCAIITLISGILILLCYTIPNQIVLILFGASYLSIASLLWLYALATAFYALAAAFASYYLSLGRGTGNYFVLTAGIAQVIGLLLYHQSLLQVVLVQVVLMAILVIIVLIWDITIKKHYRIEKAL